LAAIPHPPYCPSTPGRVSTLHTRCSPAAGVSYACTMPPPAPVATPRAVAHFCLAIQCLQHTMPVEEEIFHFKHHTGPMPPSGCTPSHHTFPFSTLPHMLHPIPPFCLWLCIFHWYIVCYFLHRFRLFLWLTDIQHLMYTWHTHVLTCCLFAFFPTHYKPAPLLSLHTHTTATLHPCSSLGNPLDVVGCLLAYYLIPLHFLTIVPPVPPPPPFSATTQTYLLGIPHTPFFSLPTTRHAPTYPLVSFPAR